MYATPRVALEEMSEEEEYDNETRENVTKKPIINKGKYVDMEEPKAKARGTHAMKRKYEEGANKKKENSKKRTRDK